MAGSSCEGGWVCSVAITRQRCPRAAAMASTEAVVIMPSTTVGCSRFINWRKLQTRRKFARTAETRPRSEEHTSELQSLMRISYAVFCLKDKNRNDLV